MRYKFKIGRDLSADTFATRDAALAAGLLQAGGAIAGVATVATP